MQHHVLRWKARLLRALTFSTPHVLGAVLAALMMTWWLQTLSHWGASLEFVCGLLMAAGIAAAVGIRQAGGDSSPKSQGTIWLMLVGWSVALPVLAGWLTGPLSLVPVHWLEVPSFEFLVGLLAGGCLLSVPHYGVARLLQNSWSENPSAKPSGTMKFGSPETLRASGLGMALALTLIPAIVLPSWDAMALGGVACLVALLTGVALITRPRTEAHMSPEPAPSPTQDAAALKALPWQLGVAVLSGAALVLVVRLQSQLWLTGPAGSFAVPGGMLAGLTIARRRSTPASPMTAALLAGLTAAVILGGFRSLVEMALAMNAHVSSAVVLMTLRGLLCAGLALPAGLALGLVLPVRRSARASETESLLCLACVTGVLVTRWWMSSLAVACLVVLACAVGVILLGWYRSPPPVQWTRRRALGWSLAGMMCVGGVWRKDFCEPSYAARLLFSTQTNIAARTSDENSLLTALDDGRLLATREGRAAVWTLWKHRGAMLILRENGIPVSGLSLDPGVTPQVSSEVMAAVLPLALHPRPDHVLVVGLGGTTTVSTCLEFPVHQVTCYEADEELVSLLGEQLHAGQNPVLFDDRVDVRTVAPALASGCAGAGPFDVILLNHSQPALPRTLGTETLEAFQRWSRLMTDEGVLCQRLSLVDIGAQPVRDAARTLAAVFPQVMLWESAPGEVLLIATRSEQTLVKDDLLDRLGSPHARRVLAQIDWDWTMPLSFMASKPDTLRESLTVDGRTNNSTTARAACRLPSEVARWGNKWQEVRQLIQPHATPVVSWLDPSPEVEAVHKRLADIAEQRTLINTLPDHYWAYRNTLRERLQDRPRTKIVQVAHEGLKRELDPEDERRKEYLKALGHAATDKTPTKKTLEEVTQFLAPYDPLVAPFLPGELARLYERSEPRDPRMELRLWLRSVYYAPPFDRSVRGAVAALNLMLEEPEAAGDASLRWDHANALLEILKQRWIARSSAAQGSRFDPVDARETIAAANRALEMLRTTASEAGIDPAWCDARCQVLERTLVRPLRTHQARQVERIKQMDREMEKQKTADAKPASPSPVVK